MKGIGSLISKNTFEPWGCLFEREGAYLKGTKSDHYGISTIQLAQILVIFSTVLGS